MEFLSKGETINVDRYVKTLEKLTDRIKNGIRNDAQMFAKQNSLSSSRQRNSAYSEQNERLDQHGWEVMDHPPHSPDIASSDFYLFGPLEKYVGGKKIRNWECENISIRNVYSIFGEEF